MEKTKILYVTQAVNPFLEDRSFAAMMRTLVQGTQESGCEIRVFMPRFGIINERRHQLHEVIRLSGMNLIIDDSDHPLIIKVASIPQARMQVYFIDNEEYFKRKRMFEDEEGKFSSDNDERSLFFCKGVLETVKKLGWKPDIVHCHGWMTGFLPAYLRKAYHNDPHFSDAKIIYSLYNKDIDDSFTGDVVKKLDYDSIGADDLTEIKDPSIVNVNKLGMRWSDAITFAEDTLNDEIVSYAKDTGKPILECQTEETIVASHQTFYTDVLDDAEVLAD